MDVSISSALLVLSFPVTAVSCLLIWIMDRRSPFYVANRVGIYGRPFRMIKLRTMSVGADQTGVDSTAIGDPRVTPIGRWLRRYKVDEIPQLWNVLRGDMSIVGPRPNVERETMLYTTVERRLLEVRPGVTDLASVVFSDEGEILEGCTDPDLGYNQLIRPWKSRLGMFYVDHQSLLLDMYIIVATVVALVSADRARWLVARLLERKGADRAMISVARRSADLVPTAPPGANAIVRSRSTVSDDYAGQDIEVDASDRTGVGGGGAAIMSRDAGSGRQAPAEGRFDYSRITERADLLANREQREMAYARYASAARHAGQGLTVEVACGAGHGLRFLHARGECLGVDLNWANLGLARSTGVKAPLLQGDGTALPMRSESASLIVCIEAMYYFPSVDAFVREAYRVLERDGRIFITAPNPARTGFIPSPGSIRYFNAEQLADVLEGAGFRAVRLYGAFPGKGGVVRTRAVEVVRRVASRLHVVPRTMYARSVLKRLLYRDVRPLGEFSNAEVDLDVAVTLLSRSDESITRYKVLFALATK